jgi:apolipoprotein N-acyltransferase
LKNLLNLINPIFFGTLCGFSWLYFESFGWGIFFGFAYTFYWLTNPKEPKNATTHLLLFLLSWFGLGCINLTSYSINIYAFAVGSFILVYATTFLFAHFAFIKLGWFRGVTSFFAFVIAMEYLQGEFFPLSPWFAIGNSLVGFNFPNFIVPIFGVSGVSLFVIVISFLISEIFMHFKKQKNFQPIKLILIIPFLMILLISNNEIKSQKLEKVIVIQPQTLANQKTDFDEIFNEISSIPIEELKTYQIFFPESFASLPIDTIQNTYNDLMTFLNKNNLEYYYGVVNEDAESYSNQIFTASQKPIYTKQKLVPDVERNLFSFNTNNPKNSKNIAICYESIYPNYFREISDSTGLVRVFTNDVWFQNTTAYSHHAVLLKYRALENGVTILRIANSGLSGVFYPNGKMEILPKEKITNEIEFTSLSSQTFFHLHGDVLGRISLFLSLFLLLFAFVKHIKY